MFPGIDGFHWTLGHVLFLSLFFAVALTILITVASAAWRTSREFRSDRAIDLWWRSQFAELPISDRRCRHELAGRFPATVLEHLILAANLLHCAVGVGKALHRVEPFREADALFQRLNFAEDRYYHRGHTWVKPEEDGTVTVGLDGLAAHLVGTPESVSLPEAGQELEVNQTAWRMKKKGRKIEVRAPIEGTVVGIGGPKEGWYLKIHPRLDVREPVTLRHLLRGPEVHGWLSRDLERLQLQLRAPSAAPALADGGVLMPDLMNAVPEADWDAVLADTFLQA